MQCRQILFTSPETVELLEQELPVQEDDMVLVEMEYTVISAGTERDRLMGRPNTPQKFPIAPGYCGIGFVRSIGMNAKKFHKNDRVLIYHGSHASFCVVREDQLTLVEDTGILSLEAAFVIIAAMSLGGLRKTRIEIGESAMVMGQGILGIFAVQLARLAGAVPLIAADVREDRRRLALEMGADFALSPDIPDFAEQVRKLTDGKGVNTVVEVTGVSAAMKQALECCAPQARISLLGCTRISDCPIDYYQLVHKPGISIIGAHNFVRPKIESYPYHWTHQDDCRSLLRMIGIKRLKVLSLVSEILSPREAPAIYRRLVHDPLFPLGVVFDWKK
jgi:2-desacetyl-2-hydroxyethyl bacteriochlorophyllide A dehydrogenase